MKLYILILLLIINTQAFAQSLASKWYPNIYKTIIYINFDVTDQDNGAVNSLIGTGFIISEDAHILTANHLFKDWYKQSSAQKETNRIYGRIGGRYSPDSYPLEFIGDPNVIGDVVLMKLTVSPPQKFEPLPLCFTSNVSAGTEIVAYGFPLGQDVQSTNGFIGNSNASGGRYSVESSFTYGMSGGPVFNQDGVIGIVKGGVENEPAVRWVTPIDFAKNLANISGFQQCNPTLDQVERGVSGSSDLRAIENPDPKTLARLKKEFRITNLKREVSNLIIDYESIDDPSDVLADKVRKQAAQVGRKLLIAPEKGVGIGHKITKYKYAAYAFMISASYEPDLSESNELIAKGIDAGRRAVSLVDELRSLDKEDDSYLVYLDSWVLEDKVDERIKYILAILYAIKAKKNDDHSIFPDVENYLDGIKAPYREERPFEKNSYLKWYLSEKNKL
ncbi:MAG: serine protease [Candidatus Electrothrix communis]|nr:MAG: serine protease [Candidatus Electrothrix communis]